MVIAGHIPPCTLEIYHEYQHPWFGKGSSVAPSKRMNLGQAFLISKVNISVDPRDKIPLCSPYHPCTKNKKYMLNVGILSTGSEWKMNQGLGRPILKPQNFKLKNYRFLNKLLKMKEKWASCRYFIYIPRNPVIFSDDD